MGFRDINEKLEVIKTSEMEVGTSFEGYVVGFQEGQYGTNMRMQVNGEEKMVFTSGSLKWAIKDNKIKLGQLTRITRLPDEKKKGAKGTITATKFKVEQDPEDTVAVSAHADSSPAAQAAAQDSFKEKIANLKANKSV